VLNALHLRQYQEYYNAIEKVVTGVTGSDASTWYEELAALNKAAEGKQWVHVCAPSNTGIDNVILKVMASRFVDGHVSVQIDQCNIFNNRDLFFTLLLVLNK
jgi:hypothetical protein